MASSVTIDKAEQTESSLEYHKERLAETAGKVELARLMRRFGFTFAHENVEMEVECEHLTAHGVSQEEIKCLVKRAERVVEVTYLTESLRTTAAAYRMALKENHYELEVVRGWHMVCLQSDLANYTGLGKHEIGAVTLGVTIEEFEGLSPAEQNLAFAVEFEDASEKYTELQKVLFNRRQEKLLAELYSNADVAEHLDAGRVIE